MTKAEGIFPAIEALYSAAFPRSERKPVQFLAEALVRPDYRLLALEDEGRFIAFALIYRSPREQVSLLEYMAVVEAMRGRGWGSRLFHAAVEAADAPLLIELESDRDADSAADVRTRRKNFYLRLGCRRLRGFDYVMPKVAEAEPPPMELLVHGLSSPALSGEQLGRWLGDIYRNVYGRRDDDPRLGAMRAAMAGDIRLT
jgi:GNAT superfamily N-acetyltransferase